MVARVPTSDTLQEPLAWTEEINDDLMSGGTLVRKQIPGGAALLHIKLCRRTANQPTATCVYVVVNARNDIEEDAMMAGTIKGRIAVPVDEWQPFGGPDGDPVYRYAIKSDAAAETNGSRCHQRQGSLL